MVGKTTVHATTVDGEFKASCLVTVNEPVTGVSLDIREVSSLYRDETVTLTPTVYPDFIEENINKNVIWTSSDESIAVVENGTVKAVGPGEAVITVTTEDLKRPLPNHLPSLSLQFQKPVTCSCFWTR